MCIRDSIFVGAVFAAVPPYFPISAKK